MPSRRPAGKFAKPSVERLEARETPTAGLLDPTFGQGGLVSHPTITPGAAVIQPDGKIVVSGSTGGRAPTLVRLNADGSVDPAFGTNGVSAGPFQTLANGYIQSIGLQPGGKIIVLVAADLITQITESLVRLDAKGQLDPTFGVSGTAPEQIGGRAFTVSQFAVRNDGSLAALATLSQATGSQFALVHYTANGKLDSTFGQGGLVALGTPTRMRVNASILPGGEVVEVWADPSGLLHVSRFAADGSPDKTFNHSGTVVVMPPMGMFQDSGDNDGLAVGPDGKILVTDGLNGRFAAVRLNADGSIDKGFGAGGFASVQVGSQLTFPGAPQARVEPDGKILLAGVDAQTSRLDYPGASSFALVRLTAAGLPDSSFGAAGVVVTPFVFGSVLAMEPDGKPLVAVATAGLGTNTALVRYRTTDSAGATTASHTTLSAPPANLATGATLTATVTSSSGTPTGSVTFLEGSIVLGAVHLDASGRAVFYPLGLLQPGSHALTAVYSGDATHSTSSAAASLTVGPAPSSVTLLTTLHPQAGQAVTLAATVTAAIDAYLFPMSGTVTFLDGNKVLGVAPLTSEIFTYPIFPTEGTAALTLPALAPGSHAITAKYNGSSLFTAGASTAVTVTVANPVRPAATTTTLSAPASATFGKPVTLTAVVTGGAKPTGTVTFRDGNTVLGAAKVGGDGKAVWTVKQLSAGVHHITASYSGDAGRQPSVSSAIAVAVARASTQIKASASPAAPTGGQLITLLAQVASAGGDVVNTGIVTFRDGKTLLGVVAVTKGGAVVEVPRLSAGKHTLTISYGGDANHNIASLTIPFMVKAAG